MGENIGKALMLLYRFARKRSRTRSTLAARELSRSVAEMPKGIPNATMLDFSLASL